MRIFAAAVLICVVTFLAGVAGDLSLAAQAPRIAASTVYTNHGPVARVRIPPPIVLASAEEAEPALVLAAGQRLRPIETPHIYAAALILEPKAPLPVKTPAKPLVLAEEPGKAAA